MNWTMNWNWKRSATLSYVLILGIQVPLFLVALQWYPELVGRLMAAKSLHAATRGDEALLNLGLTVLALSPVLLMVGPYRIAQAFWTQLEVWAKERWVGESWARERGAG